MNAASTGGDGRAAGGRRAVVVGGGIAGLVAALELSADGEVTLIEAADRFGGKIGTVRDDRGLVIETGADSFLAGKPAAIRLCVQLGLGDELINTQPGDKRTFVWSRGKLRPLPEGLILGSPARAGTLLRSGLLSPAGAARMAADIAVPARRDGAEETIAAFFTRRLGQEAYVRIVEPLMAGIHAGDATQLSLQATFPRFADMERTHGGLVRATLSDSVKALRRKHSATPTAPPNSAGPTRTPFVTLRHGTGALIDALVARLRANGVTLVTSTRVTALHPAPDAGPPAAGSLLGASSVGAPLAGAPLAGSAGGERGTGAARAGASSAQAYQLDVEPAGGGPRRTMTADVVVLATPASVAATLLADLSPPAAGLLQGIPHASTATVSLVYDEVGIGARPAGYGFVVPRAEGRDLLAGTFSSNKWPGRAPAGQVLVRGYVGGVGREATLDGDDDHLVSVVRSELSALAGITGTPRRVEIQRFPSGMPQYNLGHQERVRAIRAELAAAWPGLVVTGAPYGGVGIPDCITDATSTVAALG